MKKLLLLVSLMLSIFPISAFAFGDVDSSSELGFAVDALVNQGVVNGYPDNTFKPDNDVTRAEFCKMVNTLFNFTDVGRNNFTDVKVTDWFYMQVLIADEFEYIKGYDDNTFRGNNKVTREQAAVIIDRITPLLKIDDIIINDEISLWAKDAVQMIANHNLLRVDENSNFRGKENLKRSELALLLARFIPEGKTDTFEEGYRGTNAEIAIENAVILANLKACVRDIESVTFNENEKEIIRLTLIGLNGTIDAGLNGQLINKNYVVRNFTKEIDTSRRMYRKMSEDDKARFHANLVKLNNSTLLFLQSYFLGDKDPV